MERLLATIMVLSAVILPGSVHAAETRMAAGTPKEQLLPIEASKANVITFAPAMARFIRLFIHASSNGQPCIDELEVYGRDDKHNLALFERGARASASSCLPGYDIHKVVHLNDGRYGNDFSWIAASDTDEWAQVELKEPAEVTRLVLSRDRNGRYRDRVPDRFDVLLSIDGKKWTMASSIASTLSAGGPGNREPLTWEVLLQCAFTCEETILPGTGQSGPVATVLGQMSKMITRFRARGLDVTKESSELKQLRNDLAKAEEEAPGVARELYQRARHAKRRLFFRDPELTSLQRILFTKRHPFEPSHNYSVLLDGKFRPGGGVYLLEIPIDDNRLDPEKGKAVCLFDAGPGMVRTPASDFSASRIYFSYRPAKDGYYRIMAMDADGRNPLMLTEGQTFHDFWPCPLPDGGIAFISTRCKARFLCWRPQAFVLFRMDADGSKIRPLSFANLSEWSPSVMRDGRIIWTRSEYIDKGADFGHTLWAIRPNGTHPELVFGNNTIHGYANGREVPGTAEICATLVCHAGDLNGPVALIDTSKGLYNTEAIKIITPEVKPAIGMSGAWPRKKCFRDPVPLTRDYFLCSHAPGGPFGSGFGIYIIDRFGNRELLYYDEKISSICPTPFGPVPAPPVLSGDKSAENLDPNTGQFFVQDVYNGLGPSVKRGTIKYIRVCEEVRAGLSRLPNGEYRKDHVQFTDFYATPVHKLKGAHGWPSYVAKGVLGIVPVNEDGSASFFAPSGKVLYFQVLDKDFNEIQRMRSVIQLQPGEKRSCIGCHEDRMSSPSPVRTTATDQQPRKLIAPPWGAGPFSYEKIVQPVWDAKCIRCHNEKHKRGYNLTGGLDGNRVPASYRTVIDNGWVHYFNCRYNQRHTIAEPLTFGSVKSKLWKIHGTQKAHNDVKLTEEEMRRVKCWIDLNCPLWPDYLFRPDRPARQSLAADTSKQALGSAK